MIQIYAKLPFPSFHVREDDKLDLLYRVYVYAQSVGLLRIILQWIGTSLFSQVLSFIWDEKSGEFILLCLPIRKRKREKTVIRNPD